MSWNGWPPCGRQTRPSLLSFAARWSGEEQEFQQECAELRGRIDELHRTLVSAEQAHGDERSRLDEQHHQAREELESARSEIRVLRPG